MVDGGGQQVQGNHIVDVFDENDVAVLLVQIFDEGAVSAGAEKQLALLVAEGTVVGCYGKRLGMGLLKTEGDVQYRFKLVFNFGSVLVKLLFKQFFVFGTDGKMNVDQSVAAQGKKAALHQMFLHSGTQGIGVSVKMYQSLG